MIKVHNLHFEYKSSKGATLIFHNFSLDFEIGKYIFIYGPNGCGKSTLLNLIRDTHVIGGNSEMIIIPETKIVDFVFQDYKKTLLPWMDVQTNIFLPFKSKIISEDKIKYAKSLLQHFKLNLKLNDHVYNLSGGQKQILILIRNLLYTADLNLFDEGLSALNIQAKEQFFSKIKRIEDRYYIFVSHDIDTILTYGDKVHLLSDSKPTNLIATFEINDDKSKQEIRKNILNCYN